jgi:hypothetical protein
VGLGLLALAGFLLGGVVSAWHTSRPLAVVLIATTPENLWNALTDPDTTAVCWDHRNVSDWQFGSSWEHQRLDDARTVDVTARLSKACHLRSPRTCVPPVQDPICGQPFADSWHEMPFM